MSQKAVSLVVAAPVGTGGVITVPYPAGYHASDFAFDGHDLFARGLQTNFSDRDGGIAVAFGSPNITVTYFGHTAIPYGSWVTVDFELANDSHYVAEVGDTPRSAAARASAQVIEAAEFGVEADADPLLTTQQMTNALNTIADLGSGRILQLPYGRINITAADGSGDGTAFILGADLSCLHVRGSGRGCTTIVTNTNRVEGFAQAGAAGVEFSDLTFESPSILQNQVKGAALTQVGGGVAKLGNGANTAIRQYSGDGLTLRKVGFTHWACCVNYIGDYLDNTTLHGTMHFEDIVAEDYVQALLTHQPKVINFININLNNGRDSINADATIDPGHGIYITDRTGAHPEQAVISNVKGSNSYSSIVKVRKGRTVVVDGVTAYNCGRGVEINNCERATASNLSIRLTNNNIDTGRNGLNFDNTGIFEVSNVFIDIRGTAAWGVRIRPDPTGTGMPEYPMQYGRLSGVTVLADFSAGVGNAPLSATEANDLTIENFRLVHAGTVVNSRWPIQLVNCQRTRVLYPQHSAIGHSADASQLVSIDAACVDCSVIYHDAAIDVPVDTTYTVYNVGTGTKITRLTAGTPTAFDGHLRMMPLPGPPPAHLGSIAFSDGADGPDHWGNQGPGPYWWNGNRWKALG